MKSSNRALISLGSNLPFGDLSGPALLEAALRAIDSAGLSVQVISSAWRSDAWPDPADPPYVNAVAAVDADDRPADKIYALLSVIEARFGRRREQRWAARTLDLDLIDLGGRVKEIGGVIIPHPRYADRRFVLEPLREIDPLWVDPASGLSIGQLLAAAKAGEGIQRIGPLRIAREAAAD